jgi:dihydrolipoamide dehydrogenase
MENKFDLVVIGSGPGGYTGAIRASQLGLKVAIVEKEKTLGGTCLNWGCIPSKALLDSSEHFADASHGTLAQHGLKFSKVELDLPAMMARKDKIVKDLTSGVAFLMKKNKIERFDGLGVLKSAHEVEVKMSDGSSQVLTTQNIMIATGSTVINLPFAKVDGKRLLTSTEALSLPEVPGHLIVIGGGVIGLELGSVWLRLGAKVTVVEYLPMIGGGTDLQTAKLLLKLLQKQGMEFQLGAQVQKTEVKGDKVEVTFTAEGQTQVLTADYVLVAAGRKPYTDGLGLEALGILKDERGRIKVDEHLRTQIPSIYAIGDVIAGPMLAHKAEEEGVACAERIAGRPGHVNYNTVPSVIYTWPEVAAVGFTEEQLKEKGIDYKVGTFPFAANGRAKAMAATDGQVKVLADAKTDRILGVHVIGPHASALIAEAVVAMEFFGSAEDLARSFHAHPTLSEVMREAALAVDKRARQA